VRGVESNDTDEKKCGDALAAVLASAIAVCRHTATSVVLTPSCDWSVEQ